MRIGIVAGGGQFPIIFSKQAKTSGHSVFAVAHVNETDPELENYVDAIKWIHLGQLKRLLSFFKTNKVTDAVMMGTLTKTRMFKDVRPDMKAISMFASMKDTHDDKILRAFAEVLEKEGITVRASTFLLPDILATKGCWTKRKPSAAEKIDIKLGWKLAKEVGRLDIGQCMIIGGGTVLAVEAIEGTDAAIRRGGELGKSNAVVVKVCKPNQDLRFDIPAVGVETVKTMYESKAKVLAIEAQKAVVFDKEEMIAFANKFGIVIFSMSGEADVD